MRRDQIGEGHQIRHRRTGQQQFDARLLARRLGCPAICRDEIKEGMVHAAGDFVAAPSDELTLRALPTFFTVLQLLLTAGVTTVAEAASKTTSGALAYSH